MFANWQTDDIRTLNNLVGATWNENGNIFEISSSSSEELKIEGEENKEDFISETTVWKNDTDGARKEKELIEWFLR